MDRHNDGKVDLKRRRFLIATTRCIAGVGVAAAAIPFLASWGPSAKAEAEGAPVEVDISALAPGKMMVVEWRGKPIWIVRRTEPMLQTLQLDTAELRDPNSEVDQQPPYAQNMYRSIKPEYLVLVGICTHLGCSPLYKPAPKAMGPHWLGGFFCPCHGSRFDLAGRVFKGVPAPINLEVPPYTFLNDTTILIGQSEQDRS